MGLFDFLKKKPDAPVRDTGADLELAKAIFTEIQAETARPVLRYTLEEGEPSLFESKVGGTPYLPHGESWPLDARGAPMDLLAQVDCAALAGLPDFPHRGLLQFFIARDDVYGIDFDDGTAQTGFRVLYRESVDESVTAEEVKAKRPAPPADGEEYSPVMGPCRIVFAAPEVQGLTQSDYRFDGLFLQKWNERRPEDPLEKVWKFFQRFPEGEQPYDVFEQPAPFQGSHHQMGGCPTFVQEDPRYQPKYRSFDVLLFQLDSEQRDRRDLIMWGDCGVGNFFISQEALKSRDLSQVLYNWDCG